MSFNIKSIVLPQSGAEEIVNDEYIHDLSKSIGWPIFPINKITINGEPVDYLDFDESNSLYVDKFTKFLRIPWDDWTYDGVDITNVEDNYSDYFYVEIVMVNSSELVISICRNAYFPEDEGEDDLDLSGQMINIEIFHNEEAGE